MVCGRWVSAVAFRVSGGFLGYFLRLAVLADFWKSFSVGRPFSPGLAIRSPEPALIRALLAFIAAYSPLAIGYLVWGYVDDLTGGLVPVHVDNHS